ncbi:unnamed protein product [Closterium sp. NIES-53]
MCGEIVLAEPSSESAQESPEACGPFFEGNISVEPRVLKSGEDKGKSCEVPEGSRHGEEQGKSCEGPEGLRHGEEKGKPCEVPEGLRHVEEQGKDHHSRCPSFSLWVSPTPRLPSPSSPLSSPLFTPSNVFSCPTVFTPLTTPPSHPLASSTRPLTNNPVLALKGTSMAPEGHLKAT